PPPRSTLFPYTTLFRSALSMTRVFVTGGSGGLGRDVVHAVLAQGQSPCVFTHRQDVMVPKGAELAQGDLRTGDGLDAALDGVSRSEEHTSELQSPCNLV